MNKDIDGMYLECMIILEFAICVELQAIYFYSYGTDTNSPCY